MDYNNEFNQCLKVIGKKIKQARLDKGLKQIDFDMLPYKISISQFQRIENGNTNFNFKTLFLISKKLDCEIKDLIE